MRLIHFLGLMLIGIMLQGQQDLVDSLSQRLDTAIDQEKITILIEISNATFFADTEFSRKHAKEAEQLLKANYDGEQLARVYRLIGITYDIEGRTDSSKHYFTRFYEQCLQIGNIKLAGNALNNLGMSSWNSGKFDLALDYFYQSLKIADSLSDNSSRAKAYNNIALINQELNNYRKALEFNQLALEIRKEERSRDISDSYNNIGICYKNLGLLDSSIFSYLEGLDHLGENDLKRQSDIQNNIGIVYLEKGELDLAKKYFNQALTYTNNKLGNLFVYSTLSEVYYLEGNSAKGIEAGLKALSISREIKNFGHLEEIYFNLSRSYALSGQMELFDTYIGLWDMVKDSVFSDESSRIYNDLELAYETEKKEQQIALQEAQLSRQQALLERNRYVAIALIITVLAVVALWLLNRNRLRKKQQILLQQEKLHIKEAEIKASISSQEKERSRYARDLHDGFGQMISILNMHLGSLRKDARPAERQKIFESSEQVIHEMYDELKGICFNLMPQTLIKNGLKSGLEEFTTRINQAEKVFVETNFFGLEDRLSQLQEISIYRITQEWINNVLKYSDATKITLQITRDQDELTLLIEDNGAGFSKELLINSKGHGWKNMHTRANLIKGILEIETTPAKQGTTLILNAPVPLESAAKTEENTLTTV